MLFHFAAVVMSEQVRRIHLSRLWDTATGTVSYKKLVGLVRTYYRYDFIAHYAVTFTYLDEDGDSITISTDEELADAFGQFADKTPPVLRATATVRDDPGLDPVAVAKAEEKAKYGPFRGFAISLSGFGSERYGLYGATTKEDSYCGMIWDHGGE